MKNNGLQIVVFKYEYIISNTFSDVIFNYDFSIMAIMKQPLLYDYYYCIGPSDEISSVTLCFPSA